MILNAFLQHCSHSLEHFVFGQSPKDPLPLRLELCEGHNQAHQLPLQCGGEEIVCCSQVRRGGEDSEEPGCSQETAEFSGWYAPDRCPSLTSAPGGSG
jgi:hypothetical protein